ncbi:hypothetical protein [Pyrodictium occultum]|uniref:hypothetical protein n=1 Tax=Pyrodictium occultum TaxID=2309 RepID=UPI001442FDE5|nr:hypothetical protein [Pyrodictium occultum]
MLSRGSFWLGFSHENGTLVLRVEAIPIRAPRVNVSLAGGTLAVRLGINGTGIDPYRDVGLPLYTPHGSSACAGITPPGWRYKGIPYIEAGRWALEGGSLVIEVDVEKLAGLTARACGAARRHTSWYGLGDYPAYAYRLREEARGRPPPLMASRVAAAAARRPGPSTRATTPLPYPARCRTPCPQKGPALCHRLGVMPSAGGDGRSNP